MVDKKDTKPAKTNLSEEVVQRVKAHIIHGDVGYGRPPKEHQFQQGRSGNPKGRPRKAAPDLAFADQPFLVAVDKSISKTITIRENGVAREMSSLEALVESVKISAIAGRNARAQGLLADGHARQKRRRRGKYGRTMNTGLRGSKWLAR